MTENSIPVNYFNIKVNIASSENINNAGIAEEYHLFIYLYCGHSLIICLPDTDHHWRLAFGNRLET